ncbi:MAG TPA: DUF4239 domain-containing protein [Terriglobales bacterium]|nr:DUF4239 domain-containing protein [Terriglobales bacterium]
MLTVTESASIVVLAVVAALLFTAALNWFWPWEKRRAHNEQIGWQLSVLGTTYAVILGFMLYAVWSAFGEAQATVDLEANALVNIYQVANGLPEQQRRQLQDLAYKYAEEVLHDDWPEMAAGRLPEETMILNRDMWKTLMSVQAASPTQIAAESQALSQLSALTEHRRSRLMESMSGLPKVLWFLLIIGGCVTVASSCLFGSSNTTLHLLQVAAFALVITLALVTIADIHRPFQGYLHISSHPFVRAERNMQ